VVDLKNFDGVQRCKTSFSNEFHTTIRLQILHAPLVLLYFILHSEGLVKCLTHALHLPQLILSLCLIIAIEWCKL
jgi:hypothetical protein